MTLEHTDPQPLPTASHSPTRDPDLLNAGAALIRAAERARALALATGTPCYIWRDGRIVNIGAPATDA